MNSAVFEGITTTETFSDRKLGKNEILTFDNELDFSFSGNIDIRLTPDLANRCRIIRLFLEIEDANARKFDTPNLHKWVRDNRDKVLSALYALIRNWVEKICLKVQCLLHLSLNGQRFVEVLWNLLVMIILVNKIEKKY